MKREQMVKQIDPQVAMADELFDKVSADLQLYTLKYS